MKRLDILNMLKNLLPATKSTEDNILNHFYFSGSFVSAFNNFILISFPLKTDLKCFVDAKKLIAILTKIKSNEIELSMAKNGLHIKSKGYNGTLSTINNKKISKKMESIKKSLKKVNWINCPDEFKEAISICRFTCSKSISDESLIAVYLNGNTSISCDNRRASIYYLSEKIEEMFIPEKMILPLISINPIEYGKSKSWIHFKNSDGCVFSIRKMNGKFPEMNSFFEFEGNIITLPKDIIDGINVTEILSSNSNPSVTISIKKKKCYIYSQSDAGKMEYKTDIDYKGKDITFHINPSFLKEIIQQSTTVKISEDNSRILMKTDKFQYLAALQK